MAKAIVGVIGGSGVYHLPGLTDLREETGFDALGRAFRRAALRPHRRHRRRLSRAPWPRPSLFAVDDQLPRQYRRPEARRRHGHHRALRLRLVPPRALSRHVRDDRPVRRPHLPAPVELFRHRLRRACLDGPSDRPASAQAPCRRGRGRRRSRARDGGTYVCMEGPQFSSLAELLGYQARGRRRHRHDRRDRGEARARGRDFLRDRRHGDRLRLLARGARRGRRRLGA